MSQQERQTMKRRDLMRGAALLAGGIGLAASGQSSMAQSSVASPEAGGEWSFTDARGITITLPQRPTNVVAQTFLAQSLYDFGYTVAGHFGVDNSEGGFQSTGDLDLATVPFAGVFGEYDIEQLLALDTDLFLDFSWDEGEDASFWYLDAASLEQFETIAPVLGISMAGTSINDNIEFIRSLAEALGSDVSTPEILADKAAYEEASAALTASTEANPGIKVLALQGIPEEVYLANPAWHADLVYFGELGVTFAPFEVTEASAPFWGTYSSEELGIVPTDLYLTIGDLSGIPIWNELPAVEAGQVGEWRFSTRVSYPGFAINLTELATLIEASVIVSE